MASTCPDNGYVTGHIGKWDYRIQTQGALKSEFAKLPRTRPRKTYRQAKQTPKKNNKGNNSKYFCINREGKEQWLTDYDGDSMVDFIATHKEEKILPLLVTRSCPFQPPGNPGKPVRPDDSQAQPAQARRWHCFGGRPNRRLLNVLEKHNLRKNTLVLFSSDNGANGSEGGSSAPYTGGKGQGTQKELGTCPDHLLNARNPPQGQEYQDVSPTSISTPPSPNSPPERFPSTATARDLFPYLSGTKPGDAHEYLFWLNNEQSDAERRHLIAVRRQDWRLYRKYDKTPGNSST